MTSAEDHADLWARRAASFGAQASAYAEHRPDYPAEAIKWCLDPLESSPLRVLDLAAGTGKLTEGVVALGHHVTAVEPDEQMLSELVRRNGGVRALPGTAERIPVPGGTVDAVVVGQAFHWFDQARALAEIARVLRPGGVLAALWTGDDHSVPWVADYLAAVWGADGDPHKISSAGAPAEIMPRHEMFHEQETARFAPRQRRTPESLVAPRRPPARVAPQPQAERRALVAHAQAIQRSPEATRDAF
ncbi:class I SAM-dependent methyltransferase, partial [Actinosynnema sp.]|uniref:class I SAM-dependent methyltransferase n=1 Tax=Actinosynnema sp. TaxID=1872144 RepID=UPI003F8603D5